MATDTSSGKWRKIIIIAVVILFLIIVLITFFVGISGLKQFFLWLLGITLFLAIIFGVIYLFWIIFIKKEYKDIPASYKKKLIMTAKLMKNRLTGNLYLSGDTKHNRIMLGNFVYMRIRLPKSKKIVKQKDVGESEYVEKEFEEFTEPVPVDCFVLVKKGVWDILFGKPIFILVKPQDHDYSSIFNDVTIKGFNLVPLDSQFFTIDRRNLDVDIIKGIATNYIREVVYEIFTDLDRLVKQAMNLDQQFQKDKQKNLEFEIPQIRGWGEDNQKR